MRQKYLDIIKKGIVRKKQTPNIINGKGML
jgi:hypothetical protein